MYRVVVSSEHGLTVICETKPNETKSNEMKPNQTKPNQTKRNQTLKTQTPKTQTSKTQTPKTRSRSLEINKEKRFKLVSIKNVLWSCNVHRWQQQERPEVFIFLVIAVTSSGYITLIMTLPFYFFG